MSLRMYRKIDFKCCLCSKVLFRCRRNQFKFEILKKIKNKEIYEIKTCFKNLIICKGCGEDLKCSKCKKSFPDSESNCIFFKKKFKNLNFVDNKNMKKIRRKDRRYFEIFHKETIVTLNQIEEKGLKPSKVIFICDNCIFENVNEKINLFKKKQKIHVFKRDIHSNIICDNCERVTGEEKSIVGNRYSCKDCGDYDLCEKCFLEREKFHDKKHIFDSMEVEVDGGNDECLILQLSDDSLGIILSFINLPIDFIFKLSTVCRRFARFFYDNSYGFLSYFNLGKTKTDKTCEKFFLNNRYYEKKKVIYNKTFVKDDKIYKIFSQMFGSSNFKSLSRVEKFKFDYLNRNSYIMFLSLIPDKKNNLKQFLSFNSCNEESNILLDLFFKKVNLRNLEICKCLDSDITKFKSCKNLKKLYIIKGFPFCDDGYEKKIKKIIPTVDLSIYPNLKHLKIQESQIKISEIIHTKVEKLELILSVYRFRQFNYFPNLKSLKCRNTYFLEGEKHYFKNLSQLEVLKAEAVPWEIVNHFKSSLRIITTNIIDKQTLIYFSKSSLIDIHILYIITLTDFNEETICEIEKLKPNEFLKVLKIGGVSHMITLTEKFEDFLKCIKYVFPKLELFDFHTIGILNASHSKLINDFPCLKKLKISMYYYHKQVDESILTPIIKNHNLEVLKFVVEENSDFNPKFYQKHKYLYDFFQMKSLKKLYTNFELIALDVNKLSKTNITILQIGTFLKEENLSTLVKDMSKKCPKIQYFCLSTETGESILKKNVYQRKMKELQLLC